MKVSRKWSMPSRDTFSIKPIRDFIGKVPSSSIDPFARNSDLATWTNDLNPNTKAIFHMDALEFIQTLGGCAELVFYDPPYSIRQLKECYEGLGKSLTQPQTQRYFADVKDEIGKVVCIGGEVLSFGWAAVGMGKNRGFEITEILLVCHGGMHNDTICLREKKVQPTLGEFE